MNERTYRFCSTLFRLINQLGIKSIVPFGPHERYTNFFFSLSLLFLCTYASLPAVKTGCYLWEILLVGGNQYFVAISGKSSSSEETNLLLVASSRHKSPKTDRFSSCDCLVFLPERTGFVAYLGAVTAVVTSG